MAADRLLGADFVRASACLMVLAHHLAQRLDPNVLPAAARPPYFFILKGSFGVAVFFVLSGFLLARPFWRALDSGTAMPSLKVYALRRAARIIPGFWLALAVTFVLSTTVFAVPLDGSLALRFFAGLFLVSDLHWSTLFPVEFNGPLWSIGFEVTSYVLLPICLAVLFWLRPRVTRVWAMRLIWIAIVGLVVGVHWLIVSYIPMDRSNVGWQFGLQGGAKVWVPRFNPFGFFAIFALGALAAGAQVRFARLRSVSFDIAALVGLAFALWSMAASTSDREGEGFGLADIPYRFPVFPLAVGLILATLPSSVLLGRLADNPISVFVARVSFGLYVWHYLIIEIARQVWLPNLAYQQIESTRLWLVVSITVVAIGFVIATASFYLLEQPIIRWAARGGEPRREDVGARAGIRASSGAGS
jgi:peptidoglycan/LPS O-acetylase OafA/YrhL